MHAVSDATSPDSQRRRCAPWLGLPGGRFLRALAMLAVLLGSASAIDAQTVITLAWDANTEPDIAGYQVSYGTQSGAYSTIVDVGNVTSKPITITSGIRYYFAVKAYTSSTPRLYSPYSTEVSYPVGGPSARLLWRHAATGQNVAWFMNGVTIASTSSLAAAPDPNWEMAATADFNGDGQDDIVWHNLATGQNVIWFMNGSTLLSVMSLPTVADRGWQIGAAIDLSGDGQPDLVWRNAVTGQNVIWVMNGETVAGIAPLPDVADPLWQVVGAGDFNGDGHPDLVWRHLSTGQNVVWFLDGVTFLASAELPPVTDLRWYIGLVGDFNGDGHPDLVWRNAQSGENVVWYLDGLTLVGTASLPTVADTAWDLAGHRARLVPVRAASDFNFDARPDLVWRNAATGENGIWFTTGTTRAGTAVLPTVADVNWQLAATADVNGDGMADLIWRNRSTGQNAVWFMNGSTFVWQAMLPPVPDTNWQLSAAADFNGDGRSDLVWRNAVTGQNAVWLMDGTTTIGTASLPSVTDANWGIVAAIDLNGDGATDLVCRNAVTGENAVWFMSGGDFGGHRVAPDDGRPELAHRHGRRLQRGRQAGPRLAQLRDGREHGVVPRRGDQGERGLAPGRRRRQLDAPEALTGRAKPFSARKIRRTSPPR